MDDRELLTLSAKAAGVEITKCDGWYRIEDKNSQKEIGFRWSPLIDIDTAMFIALELNFTVSISLHEIEIQSEDGNKCRIIIIKSTDSKKEVLCRAITMLAADIGSGMK